MARDDVLEPIRIRAYSLWEQAGRPEGGDLEFWERARKEIEAEQAAALPKPDPAAKDSSR
jgi:hypothetical protein